MNHRKPSGDTSVQLEFALTLITQGQQQAERGARILFDAYYGKFKGYFARRGQTAALAEELASETLLKIVLHIHTVQNPKALQGWIWSIAYNTLVSHLRSEHAADEALIDTDDAEWEALLESHADTSQGDSVQWLCLEQQLARYADEHPERSLCMERIVVDGWGLEEISHFLGRSYAATKEYLSQCRKKMQQYLSVCLD